MPWDEEIVQQLHTQTSDVPTTLLAAHYILGADFTDVL